jgi:hypothetical protein
LLKVYINVLLVEFASNVDFNYNMVLFVLDLKGDSISHGYRVIIVIMGF